MRRNQRKSLWYIHVMQNINFVTDFYLFICFNLCQQLDLFCVLFAGHSGRTITEQEGYQSSYQFLSRKTTRPNKPEYYTCQQMPFQQSLFRITVLAVVVRAVSCVECYHI